MRANILLICLTIVILGCLSDSKTLSDYEDVNQRFEPTEIKDLEKIIGFFNTAICESEGIKDGNVLHCYEKYFKRMRKSEQTGKIEIAISYQDQEKLMNEISLDSFDDILRYKKSWKKGMHQASSIAEGKYVKFLKEVGNDHEKVKTYADRLAATGDISPSLVAEVLINYKDFDVRDDRVKLLIAIHYLTMNQHKEAR